MTQKDLSLLSSPPLPFPPLPFVNGEFQNYEIEQKHKKIFLFSFDLFIQILFVV
jgi:hypothetical protein